MKKNILIATVILILAVAAILAPKFLTKSKDENSEIENTVTLDATSSVELAAKKKSKKSSKTPAATISIKDFAFSPADKTVSKGTTVSWTNNDTASHSIMSNGKSGLKSQLLNKNSKYSFKFDKIGTFSYYCSVHPAMEGTITVK